MLRTSKNVPPYSTATNTHAEFLYVDRAWLYGGNKRQEFAQFKTACEQASVEFTRRRDEAKPLGPGFSLGFLVSNALPSQLFSS